MDNDYCIKYRVSMTAAFHTGFEKFTFDGMNARMILRWIVNEDEPQETPDHCQTALDVEDGFPTERVSQNAGEWKRDDGSQRHACQLFKFHDMSR